MLFRSVGPLAGIFFDNLRFTPESKAAWINLLKKVRSACGDDMPILVNAGWSSTDLAWVAPYVHGIQFEDAIHHLADKARDTEQFYARVAKFDALVRRPSISVNEVYGKRTSVMGRTRELMRTLVYTNVAFLWADSTHGHKHAWHPEWNLPLGEPASEPAAPSPGKLARRDFTGGTVLWLPASAKAPQTVKGKKLIKAQIFGSGSILREALRAQQILKDHYGVSADVWSATSYNQLRREALQAQRWNMLHPEKPEKKSYLETLLEKESGPFIAASDYMKLESDRIDRWVPGGLFSLGTDGFGRSDTREALRRFFEVDAECITIAVLNQLAKRGEVKKTHVSKAIKELEIDPEKVDPVLA